ncbi:hypothetical protein [Thalassospira marina]|uniref:Uncharacterized protein n=1 Tax=Thalassospira marina TaxID=2048283 RepID=A0A2N3KS25_9PROT|nr:hypothetical protein [Thalassospira marina]PKR53296.1 hypothetical protein COO20_14440 [Thalassospira marina]
MEDREKPERGPQETAPSAYVSNRRLQQTRRVLSPARQSSMNRYDRPEVIERELEGKKAAAIERLAAKGINVTRIGPEPEKNRDQNPDQFVWGNDDSNPNITGNGPQDGGTRQPPSFEWKRENNDNRPEDADLPTNTDPAHSGLALTDEKPDMAAKAPEGHSQADDLLSRFTQEPHFDAAAPEPNPDLTDMAIEQHGLRLPDHKPGTPRPQKPAPTEPVEHLPSGRRRATAESYAALDSLASRPPKQPEKPERRGVERWAPRIGAYMIAAIAVGYVLVLTAIELYSLF